MNAPIRSRSKGDEETSELVLLVSEGRGVFAKGNAGAVFDFCAKLHGFCSAHGLDYPEALKRVRSYRRPGRSMNAPIRSPSYAEGRTVAAVEVAEEAEE